MKKKTIKFVAYYSVDIELPGNVKSTKDLTEDQIEATWEKLDYNKDSAEWQMIEAFYTTTNP